MENGHHKCKEQFRYRHPNVQSERGMIICSSGEVHGPPIGTGQAVINMGSNVLNAGKSAVKVGSDKVGLTKGLKKSRSFFGRKNEEHKISEKASKASKQVKQSALKAGQSVKAGAASAAFFTKEKAKQIQVK